MNLLDKHEDGCLPMSKPCRTCRVVTFLRKHLGEDKLAELNRLLSPPHSLREPPPELHKPYNELDVDISDFYALSVRAEKCLKDNQIVTLRQLVSKTEAEMLAIPNFGRRSLDELKEFLAKKGLHFGMEG